MANQTVSLKKEDPEKVVIIFLGFKLLPYCRRASKEIFIDGTQIDQTQLGIEVYEICSKVIALVQTKPIEEIDELHFEISYSKKEIADCLELTIEKVKEGLVKAKLQHTKNIICYLNYALTKIKNEIE